MEVPVLARTAGDDSDDDEGQADADHADKDGLAPIRIPPEPQKKFMPMAKRVQVSSAA